MIENIFELLGQELWLEDGVRHYVFNIIEKNNNYYCLGINVNNLSLYEGTQIFQLNLKDGQLIAWKYDDKDYHSLLDKFLEPENLKQSLEFMNILRDVLVKEEKDSKE